MTRTPLKVGLRGPIPLKDFHFREKLFHFDHERIPERVVHARGFGAHGFFETYESLSELTRADLFQRAGERTPGLSGDIPTGGPLDMNRKDAGQFFCEY